jgi:hypothetical protein
LLAADGFRFRLTGEFLRGFGSAVPDENFRAFFDEAEDGGAACSTGAEDEYFGIRASGRRARADGQRRRRRY